MFEENWVDEPTFVSSRAEHEKKHTDVVIDESKRPIFGVLTEPIRGQLYKKRAHHSGEDEPIEGNASYVPRAHV